MKSSAPFGSALPPPSVADAARSKGTVQVESPSTKIVHNNDLMCIEGLRMNHLLDGLKKSIVQVF
jgi:hypothetical protein